MTLCNKKTLCKNCSMLNCTTICNKCCNALLPFFSISDLEYQILNTGISDHTSIQCNNNAETGIRDDEYFSPKQLRNLMRKQNNSLLIIHFNTKSFVKIKNLIEEFITEIKYSLEIIGISETKINSNACLNLNIPNFDFFHNDSPTNAGGVGIYVNQSLKYKLRNDV